MSWLSDRLGIHLGNIGAPIGAAIGSVIPGVGTSIGAALGQGLGALGQGKSVGNAALQGAGAYGVSKLGGVARKLGSAAIGAVTGDDQPAIPNIPEIDFPEFEIDENGNLVPVSGVAQAGGSWQDTLKGAVGAGVRKLGSTALNTVTGQPGGIGLGDLAVGGLAGYQALQAANASKRAGLLSDKALGMAESRWNDASPLRAAGQARLLNPVKPQLTDVFTDPTNPFAARKLRSV